MLSANEDQLVTEETSVPEGRGMLGGQSVYTTESGLRTLKRIPTCDNCHKLLGEEYIVCECRRKVCKKCSIFYEIENVFYCEDCVQQRLPLSKQEYLILSGFVRLSKRKEISKLTLIKGDEVKRIIQRLVNTEFLVKKGIKPFTRYELSDSAAVALAIYNQVYGEHPDVLEFDIRLKSKELETSDKR